MLETTQLTLERGGQAVLRDLTAAFARGSVTAILGPNGAGKSSLLLALGGELAPTQGCITLEEKPLTAWSPRELARRRAVLPQATQLTFAFPCREVVRLGRLPHHGDSPLQPRDEEIVDQALAKTGCEAFAQRPLTELSGGEQRRVQLARVLAQAWPEANQPAPLLLLDEPVAGLDLRHQHETLSHARTWAREGATVIIVLHELNLATRYADQVLLLDQGKLIAQGAVQEVLQPAILEPVFGVKILPVEADGMNGFLAGMG